MSDKRPSWTVRIDGDILGTFLACCAESGNINKSLALEKILRHMVRPDNLAVTKTIIQSE